MGAHRPDFDLVGRHIRGPDRVGVGAGYLFVTSDDFRSRVKRRERLFRPQDLHRQDNHRLGLDRARSSRRRRGGQCRLGQGRPHAEGRAGRFRHPAYLAAAQGRFRPAQPRAARARGRRRGGRQGAVKLEPRRKPGGDGRRQGGSAQGTLPDTADRAARDHRRAPLLSGHQTQALP